MHSLMVRYIISSKGALTLVLNREGPKYHRTKDTLLTLFTAHSLFIKRLQGIPIV